MTCSLVLFPGHVVANDWEHVQEAHLVNLPARPPDPWYEVLLEARLFPVMSNTRMLPSDVPA